MTPWLLTPWLIAPWLRALPALGWETDQLTGRAMPLQDVTEAADARLDEIIDQALAATNAHTRCQASPELAHALLAEQVHDRVGRPERVPGRGWPRGIGYNQYGAWLEQLPQAARPADRGDIYGDLGLWQAPVLHLAGVCSTVGLAGQRVGVDKVDHFLGMGFAYWERSHHGDRPERAVRWGTWTERAIFGRLTSSVFSYADLEANYDGYLFYAGLLEPEGVATIGEDGCLVRTAPFAWADWIDQRYDEVLNPSAPNRAAARGVQRRLDERGPAVCADVAALGVDYPERLAEALVGQSPAVGLKAPSRFDPFGLVERCGAGDGG